MDAPIDPILLQQLMREHAAALELYAAQWTTMPEDCVQEAFLQLVRGSQVPDRVVPWLYRVVRNRAISWRRSTLRRRRRETAVAAERRSWFSSPRWSSLELEEVTAALRDVQSDLREVMIARIWGRLSFEQIAEVVNTSTSTAHRRYEAGLRELRERLGVQWNKKTNSATL